MQAVVGLTDIYDLLFFLALLLLVMIYCSVLPMVMIYCRQVIQSVGGLALVFTLLRMVMIYYSVLFGIVLSIAGK